MGSKGEKGKFPDPPGCFNTKRTKLYPMHPLLPACLRLLHALRHKHIFTMHATSPLYACHFSFLHASGDIYLIPSNSILCTPYCMHASRLLHVPGSRHDGSVGARGEQAVQAVQWCCIRDELAVHHKPYTLYRSAGVHHSDSRPNIKRNSLFDVDGLWKARVTPECHQIVCISRVSQNVSGVTLIIKTQDPT